MFLGGKGTPSKISKKIAFFEQIQGYKFFVEGSGLLQDEAKIEKWWNLHPNPSWLCYHVKREKNSVNLVDKEKKELHIYLYLIEKDKKGNKIK